MKYQDTEVWVFYSEYTCDNTLAVCLYDAEDNAPYGALTVNIDVPLDNNHAFVDINNMPKAEEFIKKYNLGKPTGRIEQSGFCRYPEYEFFNTEN